MSRKRRLTEQLQQKNNDWLTGMLLQNIPVVMLENDFVRAMCSAANSALYACLVVNERALHTFDISMNK